MAASRIYFAQHGLAVDKAENPERPLSQEGIQQSTSVARTLNRTLQDSETVITHVYHSGKLRAAQTADIFASSMGMTSTSAINGLAPNNDVSRFVANMDLNHALYIGHLPHLGKLVSFLVTGNENSGIIQFQNSAVVCLEKAEDHFQLRWYLTPDIV